jgi:HME family heavy-metal exporter
LPPFNEGTLLIGMRLNPGVTLAESSALARQAEVLVRQVPEVTHVGRRSGRAELDEHAEGVHVSELDVGLLPAAQLKRSMAEVQADIRSRLVHLPCRHCARPAHLAPHRPHAVGRALADRHQALW